MNDMNLNWYEFSMHTAYSTCDGTRKIMVPFLFPPCWGRSLRLSSSPLKRPERVAFLEPLQFKTCKLENFKSLSVSESLGSVRAARVALSISFNQWIQYATGLVWEWEFDNYKRPGPFSHFLFPILSLSPGCLPALSLSYPASRWNLPFSHGRNPADTRYVHGGNPGYSNPMLPDPWMHMLHVHMLHFDCGLPSQWPVPMFLQSSQRSENFDWITEWAVDWFCRKRVAVNNWST